MHRRLGRRVVAVSFVAAWLVIPCLPAAHAAVTGFTIDTFSTPGTATWTVPAGVRSVRILAVGGGGGGASGCDYSGGTFAPFGGGGGAGGVVSDAFAAVSGSVSVTTAAGGSGGGTTTSDQVEYGGGSLIALLHHTQLHQHRRSVKHQPKPPSRISRIRVKDEPEPTCRP